ncbi:MAG: T9SS type A sorting domain-containing protein [candidate division KSB1 bacterium]|nr:T9SS type A sorting domain-containing protein [candidate division KSB1 bacterium]
MKKSLIILILAGILQAGEWTTFTTANSGLAGNEVRCVAIDSKGVKWFGTDKGLSAFDGSRWITIRYEAGAKQTLADNAVNDLAVEQMAGGFDELWIATDNGVSVFGIESLDAVTKATPYRKDNTGLIDNKVTAVAVDPLRRERWFGTPFGVSRFNGVSWRSFSTATVPILAWDDVTSIGIDPPGGWKYIGTKNGRREMNGVARLLTSPNDVDAITSPSPYSKEWSGLYSTDVYAVFVDVDGTQWYGTDVGFAYHDTTETKAGWDNFTVDEGLIHNQVRAITKEKGQVVWVGTLGGLSRFEYQFGEYDIDVWKFTNYTTADGLADNRVYDIAIDADGSLWIATASGVSHFTGASAVSQPKRQRPAAFGLVKNYPNPFNPETTIEYTLPSSGRVELAIYSADGRFITGLVSMRQTAGTHRVTWNGRNGSGAAIPSGVYYARLSFDGEPAFVDVLKLVLVK